MNCSIMFLTNELLLLMNHFFHRPFRGLQSSGGRIYFTKAAEKRKTEPALCEKAFECVHAVHEGAAGTCCGRVHAERERRHQPNPGEEGQCCCSHFNHLGLCINMCLGAVAQLEAGGTAKVLRDGSQGTASTHADVSRMECT